MSELEITFDEQFWQIFFTMFTFFFALFVIIVEYMRVNNHE